MRRHALTVTLAFTGLLVMPAAAPAATTAGVNAEGWLSVTGASDVSNAITVERDAAAGKVRVRDDAAPVAPFSETCVVVDAHQVACDDAAVTEISVYGRGGDDALVF